MAATIKETNQSVLDAITGKNGKLPTQNGLYWAPNATDFLQETGPLADLYTNKNYTTNIQQYPRDLNTSKKLHSVRFYARPIQQTGSDDIIQSLQKNTKPIIDSIVAKGGSDLATAASLTAALYEGDTTKALSEAQKLGGNLGQQLTSVINSGIATLKPNYGKPKESAAEDIVDLYMPDGVEFNQQSQYNQIGILEAAASIPFLGKIPSLALAGLKNDFSRVALNSMGYTFNPQEQVMFEGIEFRTFSMSFTLTPYSSDESAAIQNIIKTFRKNAAPTIQKQNSTGFFYKPPSIFDIEFLYGGNENLKINKIQPCFLTDVTVNYAPNGTWSTFDDGTPVQTTISLSFKESVLVDSAAIESGY
jgi:hypothetical protein